MPRTDPEFSTDGGRRTSMIDVCCLASPSVQAEELRQEGWRKHDMPTDAAGNLFRYPSRYPLAGDAGWDRDNDADDRGTDGARADITTNAAQTSSSGGTAVTGSPPFYGSGTTSSSGPY